MPRALCTVLACLILIAGCQLPPEEKLPLQPLPEGGQPLPYTEVILRARLQATSGTEAFYVNKWNDLEDVARKLEQTARMLVKASDVPARHKDKLAAHADELAKEAGLLQQTAKAQDVQKTNEVLQRIHFKVRELRPE